MKANSVKINSRHYCCYDSWDFAVLYFFFKNAQKFWRRITNNKIYFGLKIMKIFLLFGQNIPFRYFSLIVLIEGWTKLKSVGFGHIFLIKIFLISGIRTQQYNVSMTSEFAILIQILFKGMWDSYYLSLDGQLKCSKLIGDGYKGYCKPNQQKNIRKFCILSILNLKNNVRLTLTTPTSKYHLDVRESSDQCFTGFLLRLIEKIKAHFFRKLFHVTLNKSYSVL